MDPGMAYCIWASMWTVGLHELIMRSLHCAGAHMVCARRRLDFLAHMRNGRFHVCTNLHACTVLMFKGTLQPTKSGLALSQT